MDGAMGAGIEQEVIAELTVEMQGEPTFNADILAIKVRNVIRELKMKRGYADSGYTDSEIEKDLYKYYSIIVNASRYDYNQLGAENEQSHSEGSISRSWVDRNDLFKGVYAIAKVF